MTATQRAVAFRAVASAHPAPLYHLKSDEAGQRKAGEYVPHGSPP